ncbi:hypothetical protein SUGI_0137140 [Cryptomeria japonica]|nr:hypothetical protein SUGI_0137140 [Cryptomeria japonica]
MARHYGIEVQDGGEGLHHFCSRDIQWTPICVENDSTIDLCATIPLGRLDAFIIGESLRKDKNGEACHGVDDTSNELRSQFAPNLSDECKAYIERLLLMDVSVDAIMDKHLDDPIFHDMLKKRDSFVTRKDVMNAATRVRSIRSRKHVHDATRILEWKKQDDENFFCFQQPQGADKPFIMGIQTAWMLDMMYQLYSCLVFDKQKLGVLVAWVVTSRNKIKDIQVWLMEVWRRGMKKSHDWRINAFITDDVSAEIQAIE